MSTGSLDVVALRAHFTCTHINSSSTAAQQLDEKATRASWRAEISRPPGISRTQQ